MDVVTVILILLLIHLQPLAAVMLLLKVKVLCLKNSIHLLVQVCSLELDAHIVMMLEEDNHGKHLHNIFI